MSDTELGEGLLTDFICFYLGVSESDLPHLPVEQIAKAIALARVATTDTAKIAAVQLALQDAGWGKYEVAGRRMREYYNERVNMERYLDFGKRAFDQFKNAFQPNINSNKENGAKNRELVRAAMLEYFSEHEDNKKHSNHKISNAIQDGLGISVRSITKHLKALRSEI